MDSIMFLLLILIPCIISATSENIKNVTNIPPYFFKEFTHAMLSKEEKAGLENLFNKAQQTPVAQQIKQILKTPRHNQLVRKK